MDDFVLSVVEAKAVPSRMFATVAGIEILVRVAGKVAQAFDLVLDGMALHQVHNDRNAMLVGFINEGFQLFGSATTA